MANKDRDAVNNGLNDLLGNVIRTDRERAGRGKVESPPEPPAESVGVHEVSEVKPAAEHSDIMTETHYDNITSRNKGDVSPFSVPRVAPAKRKAKITVVSHSTDAADRVEVAQEMSETSTMTVTLRIPQAFNEWLDEYVHRSWPKRVRKQELVTEALKLLYARRGRAGEDILSSPLLGEDDE